MAGRKEAADSSRQGDVGARVRTLLRGQPSTSASPASTKRTKKARSERVIETLTHGRDNGKIRLTCADPEPRRDQDGKLVAQPLIATPDPADRAHMVRGPDQNLLPASEVINTRPRIYPRSCCTASGMPHDSCFDWLYEAQQRLAGVPGLEWSSGAAQTERALAVMDSKSDTRLRDILTRRSGRGQ